MWWSRIAIAFPVVLVTIACGQGTCPLYQGKAPLATVDLFDGPPAQKADLMPDKSSGTMEHGYASWEVGYIFKNGRSLYVVCTYSGPETARPLTVKMEKKVQRCEFRTYGKRRPAELTCK